MSDRELQRMALEDAVGLLESAKSGLSSIEKPSFDEKRMEGYVITALSATRSALNVADGLEDTPEAEEPGL